MALDLAQAESTGDPIGTPEALRANGLSPKKFGSCSAPIEGHNKGCPNFHHCRFIDYRDRLNGRVGPGNVNVLMITPQNAAANQIKACFQYYQCGDDAKRRESDKNGWVITTEKPDGTVYMEGDTVKDKGSRRLHRKRNVDCPSCQEGKCNKMDQYEEDRVIPTFPRLGEVEAGDSASFAMRMRNQVGRQLANEKQQIALTNNAAGNVPPKDEGSDVPGIRKPAGK